MHRIAVAAALWFAMAAFGWEILVSVADVPRFVGPVLGVGFALWISGVLMRPSRSPAGSRPARTGRPAVSRELRNID